MSRISVADKGDSILISVEGELTFSTNRQFRDAYQPYAGRSFVVDLGKTTYMDSAGLGMLVRLRDHAGGDRSKVTLRHSQGYGRRNPARGQLRPAVHAGLIGCVK